MHRLDTGMQSVTMQHISWNGPAEDFHPPSVYILSLKANPSFSSLSSSSSPSHIFLGFWFAAAWGASVESKYAFSPSCYPFCLNIDCKRLRGTFTTRISMPHILCHTSPSLCSYWHGLWCSKELLRGDKACIEVRTTICLSYKLIGYIVAVLSFYKKKSHIHFKTNISTFADLSGVSIVLAVDSCVYSLMKVLF